MNNNDYPIKDSGQRQEFKTGAVRDIQKGKGRFDLLPTKVIEEIAQHFEAGALKYDEDNWRKGINLKRFLDSALRHLNKFQGGYDDEKHLIAAIWNLMCLRETEYMIELGILPKELDDLPRYYNSKNLNKNV